MTSRAKTAVVLLAAVLAASCTAFDEDPIDEYISGSPFTLDESQQEVSLVGQMNVDPRSDEDGVEGCCPGPGGDFAAEQVTALCCDIAPGGDDGCAAGTVFYWGQARNTGDVDVEDVRAKISVYNGSGALLGVFTGKVFAGDIGTSGDVETIGTNLKVQQSGNFTVCTTVPWGAAARADFQADWVYIAPDVP